MTELKKHQIDKLVELNAQIAELTAVREKIKADLLAQLPCDEGKSKTTKAHGYKLVVKRPTITKIDAKAFEAIKASIPPEYRPVRTKVELDALGYKWLADNAPEYHKTMTQCVTIKEGKPALTIEAITEEK